MLHGSERIAAAMGYEKHNLGGRLKRE